MNIDPQGEHCPDCYQPETTNPCKDADCACHRPLGISVGDAMKVKDQFGRPR